MFKHILIPTDGSKQAAKGVKAGVKLAKALGARVTGLYVLFPYVPKTYNVAALYHIPGRSAAESRRLVEREARKTIGALQRQAAAARVRCDIRLATMGQPWEAILRTARARRCDAIVMGSHGRSAIGGLLLGSEASRVLAHSKIPVVVVR